MTDVAHFNPLALTGRTYLVSGASSGLGKGIAEMLAKLGARVVLVARHAERLDAVCAGLSGSGHGVAPFDFSGPDDVVAWLKGVVAAHGKLNGIVHSAGLLCIKPLRVQTERDWAESMKVNVLAAGALARGFRLPAVNAGGGSLVFLSSVMGLAGEPAQSVYSATKGALIAMTRSLAVELAPEKIRVNCVAPAVVMAGMSDGLQQKVSAEQFAAITAQHPLGLGTANDVAGAVAFLLADTGRWVTGSTLVIDGGYLAR